MCDKKYEGRAEKLRKEGNLSFQSGKLLEALVLYNKSLCYACDNAVKSLVFANRSAVYMKSNLFSKSLENIELARNHGYPCDKLQKLNERELRCRTLLEVHTEKEPRNFFKLSYAPNKKIPFIAGCLELKESPKYGRYVVTNKHLDPGDIVAIEEPVFKFIDREVYYRRCAHCLRSNELSLIPCPSCASGEFLSKYSYTWPLKQVALEKISRIQH